MNTDITTFEPQKTAPAAPPSPAPVAPQVIVVQSVARSIFIAIAMSATIIFSVGCNVGQYLAVHRPIPVPGPAPAPSPVPSPLPPSPVPLPPSPSPSFDGPLHVSLIYDEGTPADLTATATLRSDASLAGRLKSGQSEWHVLDMDDARAVRFDKAAGWTGKTPVVAIQKESDPKKPSFYPVPASSDELVALVNKYRGK